MTLKLITGPALEPVSLAEAKLALRIDGTEFDALLPGFIGAARELAEQLTGRAFITQTWERVLDAFALREIALGHPKVLGIVSIKYLDSAAVEQTLAPALYTLDADDLPGYVLPAIDTDWPATLATVNAVRVRFTAGYGAAAADVPAAIRTWITAHAGLMLREPQAATDRPLTPLAYLDRLLDRERVW